MNTGQTILETWQIDAEYLTEVVNSNPSLRGMIVRYIAERKLYDIFDEDPRASRLRKDDDHDRTRKGDLVVTYKGIEFKIEVKSLQTNQIQILAPDGAWIPRILKVRDYAVTKRAKYNYVPNPEFHSIPAEYRLSAKYRGAAQCDASDRRNVSLPDGTSVVTTCLMVGEFDLLAAGLFGFREKWDFGFALNRDLPRSNYAKYPPEIRSQLLKSLMPVTWPLGDPYKSDPFILLDQLVQERQRKKP